VIVQPAGSALLLIGQPDHAALSAAIMDAWRADGLPEHPARALILYATHEHDNGWTEEDAAPIVEVATGRPHDFISAPDAVKHAIWPRALARIGAHNPLAAALIARHALHVYRRHRAQADWQPFFDEITGAREELLVLGGASAAERERLETDYRFLFLGDLLSLIFCNGWTDVVDAEGYRVVLTDETLSVAPDPFDGRTLELEVPARRIPARRYTSDDDLREQVKRAPVEVLRGAARGGYIRPPR
jgi:hypothetical protein